MNQFKDTPAFEELRRMVSHEIAATYLARLKEFGVPDDRLQKLAEDIGYDVSSAMASIGDYEIPGADIYTAELKEKSDEIAVLEAKVNEVTAELKEKAEKIVALEAKINEMAVLEAKANGVTAELKEKAEKIAALEAKVNTMAGLGVKANGVIAQDENFNSVYAVEKTPDNIVQAKHEAKAQSQPDVEGVLSQDQILKILNTAKKTTG